MLPVTSELIEQSFKQSLKLDEKFTSEIAQLDEDFNWESPTRSNRHFFLLQQCFLPFKQGPCLHQHEGFSEPSRTGFTGSLMGLSLVRILRALALY